MNVNQTKIIDLPSETATNGRRVQGGAATSDVVMSASMAGNADVFPGLLQLHVPKGSLIADVTYGKGVFWKHVPRDDYELLATDLQTGVDATALPYDDLSVDAVVLDPPYMEGLFRKDTSHMAGGGSHAAFRDNYSNGKATNGSGPKWHGAVLDLYYRAGDEARRVLKVGGVFIVKCQDEVSANRQRLTHVELISYFGERDFYCKDLFVVMRTNRPAVSRMKKQVHARKNHSYFLVFIKCPPGKGRTTKSSPAN
ncbi:MAG: DNA methyltransferase [Solirubrobacteraceae bacterium]